MRRFEFPDPLALLTGCVLLGAILSYVLPAGRYERRADPATGREVVVAGTYHHVARTPVGPFQTLVAIPKGAEDAASVIFLVFLAGAAFTVVDRTGALRRGVDMLVSACRDHPELVIPASCLAFATAGALENMQEEIIALVPVLIILTRRAGFDALTAVAMSIGAASVGAAFSPIDPFQVQIAQKLAGLPLLSGAQFRTAFLIVAVGFWIFGTVRHAQRHRIVPTSEDAPATEASGGRQVIVLGVVVAAFVFLVLGILRWGWDFDQLTALFLLMGIAAGLIGGLRVSGTAAGFAEGFRSMAYAAMLIGFARAIYVVLAQGQIVDTIVHGLFTPIAHLPVALAAVGMLGVQTLVHVPVPSVSGQAVLTMPVLVPLSDLLGLSRQITVLAYQYGAGLCELLTPTNGALMAVLVAAGVKYDRWLRFAVPMWGGLILLGIIAIAAANAIGLR